MPTSPFSGPSILSFPELQVVAINDFTPGVVNGVYNGTVFSSTAPVGSAAQAFRCYARPGIGLTPLPSYSTYATKTFSAGSTRGDLTMADMVVFAGVTQPFDVLGVSWSKEAVSTPAYVFDVDTATGGVISNRFTATLATVSMPDAGWPNLSKAFWAGANQVVGVVSERPDTVQWVTVPSANGLANSQTGTVAGGVSDFKTAYVGGRTVFMVPGQNEVGVFTLFDTIYSSDIQAMTNITGPSFYEPEYGGLIGAWGSVSTGEFIIIYQGGGAVVIYGDMQFPSSATTLPAVSGTGSAIGPAVATPIGMVYATDFDGAWVWNGGNTSQKISTPIQDNQLVRSLVNLNTADIGGGTFLACTSNMAVWGGQVWFPNNWLYDTSTNGWWQCEDPSVRNFQVQGGQSGVGRFFYNSPANASTLSGGTLSVPIMIWDRNTPFSTWSWLSNPVPNPGSDVVLGCVEICASNPTSTTATVSVQPVPPPGQTAYPNQNAAQTQTFTIPALTAGYRHALPLGWNDYNLSVLVTAANSNNTHAAPTLHELNLGFTPRES